MPSGHLRGKRRRRLAAVQQSTRDTAVNTACGKALEVDVVSVTKIASMLERGTENTPAPPPRPAAAASARFARDPGARSNS